MARPQARTLPATPLEVAQPATIYLRLKRDENEYHIVAITDNYDDAHSNLDLRFFSGDDTLHGVLSDFACMYGTHIYTPRYAMRAFSDTEEAEPGWRPLPHNMRLDAVMEGFELRLLQIRFTIKSLALLCWWGQTVQRMSKPEISDQPSPPSPAELRDTCVEYLFDFELFESRIVVASVCRGQPPYSHPEHIATQTDRTVDDVLSALCKLARIPYAEPKDAPLLMDQNGKVILPTQRLDEWLGNTEGALLYAYILRPKRRASVEFAYSTEKELVLRRTRSSGELSRAKSAWA